MLNFDVSNIKGSHTYGASKVFENETFYISKGISAGADYLPDKRMYCGTFKLFGISINFEIWDEEAPFIEVSQFTFMVNEQPTQENVAKLQTSLQKFILSQMFSRMEELLNAVQVEAFQKGKDTKAQEIKKALGVY